VRLDRGYAEKDKIEAKLEFSQSELGKIKAELDKSQGDQNLKYNDYNDSRQKLYKFEQEIERLRHENDRMQIELERTRDMSMSREMGYNRQPSPQLDRFRALGIDRAVENAD